MNNVELGLSFAIIGMGLLVFGILLAYTISIGLFFASQKKLVSSMLKKLNTLLLEGMYEADFKLSPIIIRFYGGMKHISDDVLLAGGFIGRLIRFFLGVKYGKWPAAPRSVFEDSANRFYERLKFYGIGTGDSDTIKASFLKAKSNSDQKAAEADFQASLKQSKFKLI